MHLLLKQTRRLVPFLCVTLMLVGSFFSQNIPQSLAAPSVVPVPVGTNPNAIVSGDFNRDGKPDFAVVNRGSSSNNIAVVLNNGSGSFLPAVYYPIGADGFLIPSIKTADFNGDGKLDLVTGTVPSLRLQPSFVQLRFGDGAGGFAAPTNYGVGNDPNTLVVADFNNDGKPDVATANTFPAVSCQTGFASVFVNNGTGGLMAKPTVSTRPRAYDIVAGDFNSDGRTDLAVRAAGGALCGVGEGIALLFGAGDGTFSYTDLNPATMKPDALEVADLNHDGHLDLVGPMSNNMFPLLNTGVGDFVVGSSFNLGVVSVDPLAADFTLDGNTDIAVAVPTANYVLVVSGNGAGGFNGSKLLATGARPTSLAVADFDGNGRPDLAVTNYDANTVSVILDVNTPTLPPRTQFDFDGDFKADIAVYRDGNTPNAPSYWYILRSSDGTFQGIQLGSNGDKPIPADYNGDGKAEVAVWRPSTGIWYTSTNPAINYGAFAWGTNGDVPLPGDFDGDGKADYAVYRPSQGNWYVLKSSNGGFVQQQFGTSTDKPVLGDFDGDGKTDFAFYRPGATTFANSFWNVIQSSNGQFFSAQFGRGEDKAVPADYDGDGKTNFAVYRPSNFTWYTSLNPATNYGAFQWGAEGDVPAPADYDHDGKADFAVFRPGSSVWYILLSGNSSIAATRWGVPSDRPVPASFLP